MRLANAFAPVLSACGLLVLLTGCEGPDVSVDVSSEERVEGALPGDAASDDATMPGETAADVTLTVGNREALEALIAERKGDVVLVDYWATWCGPCQEQFPHTVAKSVELADRGFSAISVSCDDPDDQEPVLEFLRSQNASTVTNLISEHGMAPATNDVFEIRGGLPWYTLHDREGKRRYIFCDASESDVDAQPVDQIDAKIKELLAEPTL